MRPAAGAGRAIGQAAAQQLFQDFTALRRGLERESGCKLQPSKCAVVGSGPRAREELKTAFSTVAVRTQVAVRDLGVDATQGGPRRVGVQRARVVKVTKRAERLSRVPLKALKKKKHARGLLYQAATYGIEIQGISRSHQDQIRKAVVQATTGKTRGKNCRTTILAML